MNERIKQLALEAGLQLGTVLENYTSPVKTITVEQRKFAELIVRECSGIVQNYMSRWPEDHELTKQIKEHFGVEE